MSRLPLFLAATSLFVPAILLAERSGAPQVLLGLLTAAFLFLFARSSPRPRRQIATAIVIATIGEVVLSIGWGLYDYRYTSLIPFYVPLGHGVFYLLAAESAQHELLRRHARSIVRAVLGGGSALAAGSILAWNDQWGLLWWIIAATLLLRSRNALLLSTCFVYTLLLEWLGTGLGNWQWAAVVPGLGLHSANPPSGVGVLYIVLDLLTVALLRVEGHPVRSAGETARAPIDQKV